MMRYFVSLVLAALCFTTTDAQELSMDSLFTGPASFQYKLPPLADLVDSAIINSPQLSSQRMRISHQNEIITLEKKKIMKAVTFNSQYSIGNTVASISYQGAGFPATTATATSFYSAGVYLNLTLFQVAARKNLIRAAKKEQDVQRNNFELMKRNVRLEVSNLYMTCRLKSNVLEMRREALSVSSMHLTYTKEKFAQNSLKMRSYADITANDVKIKVAYEQAFADYIAAIIQLEEMTGVNLRKK